MSKKYKEEDNNLKNEKETNQTNEKISNENTNNIKHNSKEDTETLMDSASAFSDEQEQAFKEKQKEKKKGRFEKFSNAFSKSFIPPQTKSSKWSDLYIRTLWSLIMIVCFFLILSMGHFYCAVLVFLIIICIYQELIDIPRYKERNLEVKNYYLISWSMFLLGLYYFYIRMLKNKLSYLKKYHFIFMLFRFHNFICFMLYVFVFFIFIQSLTKGYYRYQFRQFAYIHIILLIFGFSSTLIINNIFNGLIWFLLPCSLVIVNDIFAYVWGRMLGKHQLTPLSPKKTWEGFIGGFFTTMVWSYYFTNFLIKYKFILCPVNQITLKPFDILNLTCDNLEFMKFHYYIFDIPILGKYAIPIRTIILHSFAMGMFASLLAPLGGLFASAFKRSIKIKDFADTIPGHGGLTDRMDCQLLNGIFVAVWLYQFVFFDEKKALSGIIKKISNLNYQEKVQMFNYLKETLGK